jgi:hypothetical protein
MLPQNLLKKTEKRAIELVEAAMDEHVGTGPIVVEFKACEREADEIGIHVSTIVKMVKDLGVSVGARPVVKAVRGFTAKSDRWTACPSHGGSGQDVISGFAGNAAARR